MANAAVVYSRQYNYQTYTFEASGGLINSSLILQDWETDSYWSIMEGEAISGRSTGTKLKELPYGERMRWKDWVKKHPDTLVLSVKGKEDTKNAYAAYYTSGEGFRGAYAKDDRLRTKEPIFAFQIGDKKYAAPHKKFKKGRVFDLGEVKVFLYRPKKSKIYESTAAFISTGDGFKKEQDAWIDVTSGCRFDPESGEFQGESDSCPKMLEGLDTFWYNWSLTHPDTEVLK